DMTSVNTFDPAKAKQLLTAAGQSSLTLRLAQVSAFPYAVSMTDILGSQLQAIGVQLDVQPMEFPRWLQQVFTNAQDYDLTIINHVEARDIGNYAIPKYYWHYDNPDVANQLQQADAEPDPAQRTALHRAAHKQLAVERPAGGRRRGHSGHECDARSAGHPPPPIGPRPASLDPLRAVGRRHAPQRLRNLLAVALGGGTAHRPEAVSERTARHRQRCDRARPGAADGRARRGELP